MSDVFPVVLGICLDAEALWTGKVEPGAHRPILMSHGAYAINEGLGPLLGVLSRHAARATFFVPGITAERYPDAVRQIADAGHEIGSHGYAHLPVSALDREAERSEILGGIDALEGLTGSRPTVWRSASWEWSAHSLDLALEAGVTVSTNFQDRSCPYRHTRDGAPLPLVELPVHWHLADAPYFLYGGLPGRVIRPAATARQVWMEEFEGLYEDRPGAFFHLTLHVQLIGHPGRLRMLDGLLSEMAARPRTRFMTSSELASTVA